ncbi:MAG TPA: DUF1932 domain-containing protein [archaeon]|nr:DUF1932 domain-containing protein [archaeon]
MGLPPNALKTRRTNRHRAVKHGRRRAEEMREAAKAVQEAGFNPWMASATAEKQDWMARLAASSIFTGLTAESGWRDHADRILDSDAPKKTDSA